MFALFEKIMPLTKAPRQLRINDQAVCAEPRETLLQAGLRNGVAMPHRCKIGGCGTCKCRLLSGQVKELTDASYVLSAEELDAGYILACQSVPQTDVSIAVDLDRVSQPATRRRLATTE